MGKFDRQNWRTGKSQTRQNLVDHVEDFGGPWTELFHWQLPMLKLEPHSVTVFGDRA